MEKKTMTTSKVHCLVLAYPLQGHINPMLQFSKLLEHRGVRVTLVSTRFYLKNLQKMPPPTISLETISDGFDSEEPESLKTFLDRFWQVGPQTLALLLEKLEKTGNHVDCIIYDSILPWALDIAKRFGILAASFLTQNMVVNSIYYHVHLGTLQVPLTQEDAISLPSLPKLQLEDMPTFFFTYQENPFLLDLVVGQFSNIHKADWILCNSFYELEKEIEDWTMKIWPKFRSIGPNIPLAFLDKQFQDDQEYGVVQFKNEECIEWLDNKPKGSVIYVSFGSIVAISEEQLKEIAYGLRDCSSYFLWVVRPSEETKFPKEFAKNLENKGLIVSWCSQVKVLAHEAIGCFVTHCGWNSTLEALCLGIPMVAIPQWSDQSTNAKSIEDVWKMGIRVPVDESKVVRGDALKNCIKEMMESERGKEIKNNAIKWKSLAARAASECGSSHKNISEFVNELFHLQDTCT